MFKNLLEKYSKLSDNNKILCAFFINGIIVEIIKIILLIQLGDPVSAVTYGTIFSYITSYIIQFKIYKIGNFFSKILVKYIGFTLIAILFIRILVNYLVNLQNIKNYISNQKSEFNKKILGYLIMIAPVVLISFIQLFINTKYIFSITEKDNQYATIFYVIAFLIYYLNTLKLFDPPGYDDDKEETQNNEINNQNNQEVLVINNNNSTNSVNNVKYNVKDNVDDDVDVDVDDDVDVDVDDDINDDINDNVNDSVNSNIQQQKLNNIVNSVSIDTSKIRI